MRVASRPLPSATTRKKLTITWFAEWVLGINRETTQYQIRTSFDEATQSMFARNYFDAQFANTIAFASISERVAYYTADRREFLGRNGTISSPAALERAGLSGAIGATIDPCCALQVSVTIEPGETREIVMLLGAAEGEDAVRDIIARNRSAAERMTDEAVIERRLRQAHGELEHVSKYRFAIVNNVLDTAAAELRAIVLQARGVASQADVALADGCRTQISPEGVRQVLEQFAAAPLTPATK